ncbi:MAG TPA: helix-turn-helix domain-containing protein [Sedimentisphaerales bacterium]|nr:helix-turn-helix domain-containing protein [Sedimentisphaerales bacterium]
MKNQDNNPNSTKEEYGVSDNSLGRILKACREQRDLSQSDVAGKTGIKGSAISNFENGQRLPSLTQLAQLSAVLEVDLQSLILSRTYDEICSNDISKWSKEALSQRDNLLGDLKRYIPDPGFAASMKLKRHPKGRSFLDFPGAFPNIKVITGDRREKPPKTAGDIGVYSACPIDDRWIYSLGLPKDTEKVSDKEFIVSTEEKLRKKYGNSSLLVIGSPAGNHLSRIINEHSIFRFNLQKGYNEALDNVLKDRMVEKSEGSATSRKDEHLKDLKRMMIQFFAFGIIDPMYSRTLRGVALSGNVDYGTITFAINPFYQGDDFRYVAIMVAGFHHPGTIWALRSLSEPRNVNEGFVNRPYGGVVEVKIDTEKPWEERMRSAICSWDTDPYSQEDLLKGLDELKNRGSSLMPVDPEKVDQCRQLLNYL